MGDYIDIGQAPIHWKDYGGSGPVMVLVHGLGGSVAGWDVVGPRLAANFHVVALDLPGFGLTPPWSDFTLETHCSAIVAFIETFATPVTLVGNSLGGLLAELVASTRPDLVAELLLIAPATPPRLPDPDVNWPMAVRLVINSVPFVGEAINRFIVKNTPPEALIADSLERITHGVSRVPLEVIDSFVALAKKRRSFPWAPVAIPRTGQSIRRYFARQSRFVAMIRNIKAPTLVVQGVADPIVSPTSVKWLCSLRSDWELIQMEDTGHTPQLDAPIRFLSIVEPWLATQQNRHLSV